MVYTISHNRIMFTFSKLLQDHLPLHLAELSTLEQFKNHLTNHVIEFVVT